MVTFKCNIPVVIFISIYLCLMFIAKCVSDVIIGSEYLVDFLIITSTLIGFCFFSFLIQIFCCEEHDCRGIYNFKTVFYSSVYGIYNTIVLVVLTARAGPGLLNSPFSLLAIFFVVLDIFLTGIFIIKKHRDNQ